MKIIPRTTSSFGLSGKCSMQKAVTLKSTFIPMKFKCSVNGLTMRKGIFITELIEDVTLET